MCEIKFDVPIIHCYIKDVINVLNALNDVCVFIDDTNSYAKINTHLSNNIFIAGNNVINIDDICRIKLSTSEDSERCGLFGITIVTMDNKNIKLNIPYIPYEYKNIKLSIPYEYFELFIKYMEHYGGVNYSKHIETIFNSILKEWQTKLEKLMSSNKYSSVIFKEGPLNILTELINAKSYKDIQPYWWNDGLIEMLLNDISNQLSILGDEQH